jgi:hypothetical protein
MNDSSKSGPNPEIEDQIPTQRQEIDISRLPDLPPPDSRVWGRSRHGGRARWFGCGCGLVLLGAGILIAYLSLRDQVWSSYEDVRGGLQGSILTEVDDEEKKAFLDSLDRFDVMVKDTTDPYEIIGRFVKAGRAALDDHVVDSGEIAELNRLFDEELQPQSETPKR